jgi:hypothetical protein
MLEVQFEQYTAQLYLGEIGILVGACVKKRLWGA